MRVDAHSVSVVYPEPRDPVDGRDGQDEIRD